MAKREKRARCRNQDSHPVQPIEKWTLFRRVNSGKNAVFGTRPSNRRRYTTLEKPETLRPCTALNRRETQTGLGFGAFGPKTLPFVVFIFQQASLNSSIHPHLNP